MADVIQEIRAENNSRFADDTNAKPVPAKRPTIIRPNLVASRTVSPTEPITVQENAGQSSNAVKKPPPRPSGPPSRQLSITSPTETAPNRTSDTGQLARQDSVPLVPRRTRRSIKISNQDNKVVKRRPEITVVAARPLSEVVGFGKGASTLDSRPTPRPVPRKRLSLTMDSRSDTPTAPPPLPTNRPRGKYIPPPLPSNRPKTAYVHPVSTPSSGSSTPEPRITPVPKPRTASGSNQDEALNNGVNSKPMIPPQPTARLNHVPDRPAVSQKPSLAAKPSTGSSAPMAVPRPVMPQRTNIHPPVASRPPIPVKQASPPKQTSMNDILSLFGSTNSSTTTSRPRPATKPQQNTTSSDLGWQIASGIANNITAKDVQRGASAVSAAANSETGRAFGNAAVSAASSSSDPKLQLAGRSAQHMSASDVSRTADTVNRVAGSEQGQKAASMAWNVAQTNRAQNNTGFTNSTQNTASSKSGANFDLLTGFFSSQPSKPATATSQSSGGNSLDDLLGFDPVPLNKSKPPPPLSGPATGKPAGRPTIIRPGAKSGSKPSSRSASPRLELEMQDQSKKGKKPPPRPNAGPQKRTAPSRPGPPGSRKQAPAPPGGGIKPKRLAPTRPAPGKPGPKKSVNDTKSKENLPPRPGPGHPLFNYKGGSNAVHSGPRAVATFSYDATSGEDLSFNEGDHVKLLEKVSDDWYKGECNGRTGLFPANYVDVIEDVRPVSGGGAAISVTSGPRCVAKFDYDSPEQGDLQFPSGSVIKLLEHVGGDWLKGELHGKTGIFPAGYVDIVEDVTSMSPLSLNGTSSGNIATAAYDFDAADSTELSFREGDMITVLNQVNSEWLYGEVRGQKGKFPAAFIDHIPANLPDLPTPTDSSPSGSIQGFGETCVAQFDFDAGNDDELTFRSGDTITITEYVSDEWLRGKLHGREGVFPKAFVDIGGESSSGVSSGVTTPMTPMGNGKALYDFDAEGSDELSFKTGDMITQIDKFSDDWYEGYYNGRRGKFPAAFVEIS